MKEESQISIEIQKELDNRIENLKNHNSKLYSWEEIKKHLKEIRKKF
ncbi:hypothetical protein [Flavobacterium sp.]|nr:hypothetical protein [Flavobacterium sp.]